MTVKRDNGVKYAVCVVNEAKTYTGSFANGCHIG